MKQSGSRRLASGLGTLLFLLLISACDREDTTANSASALPAENNILPARDEALPTDAAEAVLTAEGFGPLRIGMSLAAVVAALGPDSEPDAVGGPEPESCDQFRPVRAPKGLLVMIEEGVLTSVSLVDDAAVATDKGLRLGASAAQVRSVYGGAVRAEAHKYEGPPAEYLTVWTRGEPAPNGVAAATARGIRHEVGSAGTVTAIHAGGPSIQYVEGCA